MRDFNELQLQREDETVFGSCSLYRNTWSSHMDSLHFAFRILLVDRKMQKKHILRKRYHK
jgi:hypothetical protein